MDGSSGGFIAPGARVTGDVRLGDDASIWFGAVLLGQNSVIEIGAQANIQDNCYVEALARYPVRIGARVSLGHNARVFGASVDERSMIAIGAMVLPGAHVGMHSIIAANATVPEGMQVPPRTLVIGHGRILRAVTEAEIQRIEFGATDYVRLSNEYRERLRA